MRSRRRGREGRLWPTRPTSKSTASLSTCRPHGCRSKLTLDEFFSAGQVPPSIQEVIDHGEVQLTASRQGLLHSGESWCEPGCPVPGRSFTNERRANSPLLVSKGSEGQTDPHQGRGGRGSGRNLGGAGEAR